MRSISGNSAEVGAVRVILYWQSASFYGSWLQTIVQLIKFWYLLQNSFTANWIKKHWAVIQAAAVHCVAYEHTKSDGERRGKDERYGYEWKFRKLLIGFSTFWKTFLMMRTLFCSCTSYRIHWMNSDRNLHAFDEFQLANSGRIFLVWLLFGSMICARAKHHWHYVIG